MSAIEDSILRGGAKRRELLLASFSANQTGLLQAILDLFVRLQTSIDQQNERIASLEALYHGTIRHDERLAEVNAALQGRVDMLETSVAVLVAASSLKEEAVQTSTASTATTLELIEEVKKDVAAVKHMLAYKGR